MEDGSGPWQTAMYASCWRVVEGRCGCGHGKQQLPSKTSVRIHSCWRVVEWWKVVVGCGRRWWWCQMLVLALSQVPCRLGPPLPATSPSAKEKQKNCGRTFAPTICLPKQRMKGNGRSNTPLPFLLPCLHCLGEMGRVEWEGCAWWCKEEVTTFQSKP